MTATKIIKSQKEEIEQMRTKNEALEKDLKNARDFFEQLTIVKLPLLVKGGQPVILECLVSREIAAKIKETIEQNSNKNEDDKPVENLPVDGDEKIEVDENKT